MAQGFDVAAATTRVQGLGVYPSAQWSKGLNDALRCVPCELLALGTKGGAQLPEPPAEHVLTASPTCFDRITHQLAVSSSVVL